MITAEEVDSSGIREKFRVVQRVREDWGEAVLTTIVDVIELACESIQMKRNNATLSSRQKDLESELVETEADERTMHVQITAAEGRIKSLKGRLTDAQSALEKLADESSRTEAELQGEMVVVEVSLETMKVHVEALKHELAAEVENKQ